MRMWCSANTPFYLPLLRPCLFLPAWLCKAWCPLTPGVTWHQSSGLTTHLTIPLQSLSLLKLGCMFSPHWHP